MPVYFTFPKSTHRFFQVWNFNGLIVMLVFDVMNGPEICWLRPRNRMRFWIFEFYYLIVGMRVGGFRWIYLVNYLVAGAVPNFGCIICQQA